MSNEVLSGERTLDSIRFGYTGLAKHGVNIVHDMVTGIDAGKREYGKKMGKKFKKLQKDEGDKGFADLLEYYASQK
jgi:hypothetical protein